MNPLITAEELLSQRVEDPASSALQRDDARHSIEVLHAIQGIRNQIVGCDFQPPSRDQGRLMISGVEISVRADCLVHGIARGREQIGAAVLHMTMDDTDTEPVNVAGT